MPAKGFKHSEESKIKMGEPSKGEKNHRWNGGKTIHNGYVLILKPEHPRANSLGYVKRARLVMEQHLGRYLKPGEVPHHKNEIKHDDRIENLGLFANHSKHMIFHNHIRRIQAEGC